MKPTGTGYVIQVEVHRAREAMTMIVLPRRIELTSVALLIALGLCAEAWAAPPRVIEATPDNGDSRVDPNVRQIKITFDQDMSNRGHSICGGGEHFPKIVGRPRWTSSRRFVFRVKLEPDREYRFSINCPSAQNFKNRQGESAVAYPIRFTTASAKGAPSVGPSPADHEAAIEVLWESIDLHYSYRDRLGLDWQELFDDHRELLKNAKSPRQFAAIAGTMLAKAEDIHIWLSADGQRVPSYVKPATPNVNVELLPDLVPNWQPLGPRQFSGEFDDGVLYLRIDGWSANHAREFEALYRFLGEHTDAPGLVVDVRLNGGGDELLARDFAGCFIDEPSVYAKNVYRDHTAPDGFTQTLDRTVSANTGRRGFRGPVAVLSGPAVVSSCEAFILMMKQAPNAVIIGATTRGSSGNPKPHDLGNGVTLFLPSWKAMTPEGAAFEGIGIPPDIAIDTKPADFADRDPVLDAALDWLRQPH